MSHAEFIAGSGGCAFTHNIMHKATFLLRPTAALFAMLLCCAGCKPSYSSDWNINGHRTSTRARNGVSRKLETTAEVEIRDGQVTKFPKGALVKLQESGGAAPRVAELRENADKMELWIRENGNFRRGSAEEESWLQGFLNDFNTK